MRSVSRKIQEISGNNFGANILEIAGKQWENDVEDIIRVVDPHK
jgi:hypothetical protein